MITDIIFIYNNPEDKQLVDDLETSRPIAFDFYNYHSRTGKRKAREMMEEWGASKLPMAILKEDDKIVKILYTEDRDRVIKDLKEYL